MKTRKIPQEDHKNFLGTSLRHLLDPTPHSHLHKAKDWVVRSVLEKKDARPVSQYEVLEVSNRQASSAYSSVLFLAQYS